MFDIFNLDIPANYFFAYCHDNNHDFSVNYRHSSKPSRSTKKAKGLLLIAETGKVMI